MLPAGAVVLSQGRSVNFDRARQSLGVAFPESYQRPQAFTVRRSLDGVACSLIFEKAQRKFNGAPNEIGPFAIDTIPFCDASAKQGAPCIAVVGRRRTEKLLLPRI